MLGSGFSTGLGSILGGDFGGGLGAIIGGIGNALSAIGQALFDAFTSLVPVVIDLGQDGLDLLSLRDSQLALLGDDGIARDIAWVKGTDSILVYDQNHDGLVSDYAEFGFAQFVEGAKTDLEGLRYFDTNNNGQLESADAEFGSFLVWEDVNSDGISQADELKTMVEAGITSVSLERTGEATVVAGSLVHGSSSVLLANGQTTQAYDVALASTNAVGAAGFITPHAQMTVMNGLFAMVAMDAVGSALVLTGNDMPTSTHMVIVNTGSGNDRINLQAAITSTIQDAAGNDLIIGSSNGTSFWLGKGNDALFGRAGADSYLITGTDFGHDRISDTGGLDVVQFTQSLDQFAFARSGDDLVIITTDSASSVVVSDFYGDAQHRIETLVFGSQRLDPTALAQQGFWVSASNVQVAYQSVPALGDWLV